MRNRSDNESQPAAQEFRISVSAIISLVLGVLPIGSLVVLVQIRDVVVTHVTNARFVGPALASLGLCSVTGIPAGVLGHISLRRIWRCEGRLLGRGIAIAGIVTGYIGIFATLILAPLLIPGAMKVREFSRRVACLGNLKQVITAIKTYSPDYGECLPTSATRGKEINVETHYRDLGILFPTYITSLDCFTCPLTRDRMPRRTTDAYDNKPFRDAEAAQCSYAYSYNGTNGQNLVWTEAASSTTRILTDRHAGKELTKGSNHKTGGRNVAYQDGHVKWISGSERLITDPENPDPRVNRQSWWSERPDRPRR